MNTIKLADLLKNSKIKYGKYYAALLNGWPLLIIFPMLCVSMAIGYLYFQPEKYVASASFRKVLAFEDELNSQILHDVKNQNFIPVLEANKCYYTQRNGIQKEIKPQLIITSVNKEFFTVQLMILAKNKKEAFDCASNTYSAIRDYQYKTYKNYLLVSYAALTNFKKINSIMPYKVGNPDLLDVYRVMYEKNYQLNMINESVEMSYKNNFLDIKMEKNAYKIKILIGTILLSLFLAILVVLRHEFFLDIRSSIDI